MKAIPLVGLLSALAAIHLSAGEGVYMPSSSPPPRRITVPSLKSNTPPRVIELPPQVRYEADVAYLPTNRAELADLYFPIPRPGDARLPAVIVMHGGGFNDGDKARPREISFATNLAANGYVAMSINYRLRKRQGEVTWPQPVLDAKAAVRWLRKNADVLGIDPERIGAMGGSAGGNLSAMLALTGPGDGFDEREPYGEFSSRVSCGVDFYGAVKLMEYHDMKMFARTRKEAPELYEKASPVNYASAGDAPMLIVHGTRDETVPLAQSEALAEALQNAGVEHELVVVPDAPHTFDLTPPQRDLRPVVLGFLDRHLKSAATSAPTKAASSPGPPNIILVMADDLGWGDVGFNGNREVKTPHLDRMAREGVQFTRFYTAAPLCSPTRGSVLTGRHPFRYGVFAAHTAGLRQGEITLAEICQRNGYATGFFGKWHLGWVQPEEENSRGYYSPPWQHGFDETFATRSAVPLWNPTVTPDGFESWGNRPGEPWKGSAYVQNGIVVTNNLEGDDSRIIMDRVVPFIHRSSDDGRPFFACVWFHAPHEPVVAGPDFLALYPDSQPETKRHYFGCITAMDEQVGRLREVLKERGLEQNTMLWFCSDNGPADPMVRNGSASAGPFRGHKHTVYEGGIRVPSLLVWPGAISQAKLVNTRMSTCDYLPTIVDMAGLKFSPKPTYPLDGISLKPAIAGGAMTRDPLIFSAWKRLADDIDAKSMVGERFKLVVPEHSQKPELYDLENDPGETANVIEQHPAVAETLLKELETVETSCQLSREGRDYPY